MLIRFLQAAALAAILIGGVELARAQGDGCRYDVRFAQGTYHRLGGCPRLLCNPDYNDYCNEGSFTLNGIVYQYCVCGSSSATSALCILGFSPSPSNPSVGNVHCMVEDCLYQGLWCYVALQPGENPHLAHVTCACR